MKKNAKVTLQVYPPDPRRGQKQQPALFDVAAVKPTDEHRYQRGYTPQRKREVDKAFEGRLFGTPTKERHFKDAVARSSMSVKPAQKGMYGIAELHEGAKKDPSSLFGRDQSILGTTEGRSAPGDSVIRFDPLRTKVHMFYGAQGNSPRMPKASRSEVFGAAVIHELGHADQHYRHGEETPFMKPGQRERYADQFMVKHFRSDPREARRGTALDAKKFTYPMNFGSGSPAIPGYRGWNKELRDHEAQVSQKFDAARTRRRERGDQGQLDLS